MKHFTISVLFALGLVSSASAYSRHSHASHGYYTSSDGYRVHGPDTTGTTCQPIAATGL